MGRVTKAFPHLSEEGLRARLKVATKPNHTQKLLVILHATVDPMPAKDIAIHAGVATQTVHNWVSIYNRSGLEALFGPGSGGRRREHMTKEEEAICLKPFFDRAHTGEIATAAEIKNTLEERVGHPLHHSVVYRLIKRNGWRTVKPRPVHVQSDKGVQEEFKKNSRKR